MWGRRKERNEKRMCATVIPIYASDNVWKEETWEEKRGRGDVSAESLNYAHLNRLREKTNGVRKCVAVI